MLSPVQLFVTPWTVARQRSLSMGFSRQEYWSGLPFPPPGDLPDPGIEPTSPVSPALQVGSLHTESSEKLSLFKIILKTCIAVDVDFPAGGQSL